MKKQMKIYRFYTNINYYDCITILSNNIKRKSIEGDFIGDVNNDNFSIKYSGFDRFGARYNPPVFCGKLKNFDKGTIIEGTFDSSNEFSFSDKITMVLLTAVSIFLFLGFVANLFSNPNDSDYQNPVIMLAGCLISSLLGYGMPRIFKKFRIEDKVNILNFIKTKLNVIDDEV